MNNEHTTVIEHTTVMIPDQQFQGSIRSDGDEIMGCFAACLCEGESDLFVADPETSKEDLVKFTLETAGESPLRTKSAS